MYLPNLDRGYYNLCCKWDVSKFPVTYHFIEKCLQRICEQCRESLQRRKAFEKLLPVSLSPLHCTFVSFHPLILTFTTCNPHYCQTWLQSSTVELQVCVGAFLFFFFGYLMYFFILGSPFSTPPHREPPH